jgi:hypothetical protein
MDNKPEKYWLIPIKSEGKWKMIYATQLGVGRMIDGIRKQSADNSSSTIPKPGYLRKGGYLIFGDGTEPIKVN